MSVTQPAQDVQVTDRGHPSRLILLHEAKKLPLGTKVRFLGCVESFNLGSDTARFSHKVEGARKTSTLKVNVEAILGIPQLTVEIGSWLNIVGYIVELPESTNKGVQAILAWNAGEVDLPEYEDAVRTLAVT